MVREKPLKPVAHSNMICHTSKVQIEVKRFAALVRRCSCVDYFFGITRVQLKVEADLCRDEKVLADAKGQSVERINSNALVGVPVLCNRTVCNNSGWADDGVSACFSFRFVIGITEIHTCKLHHVFSSPAALKTSQVLQVIVSRVIAGFEVGIRIRLRFDTRIILKFAIGRSIIQNQCQPAIKAIAQPSFVKDMGQGIFPVDVAVC